jgi:hypothetical protein
MASTYLDNKRCYDGCGIKWTYEARTLFRYRVCTLNNESLLYASISASKEKESNPCYAMVQADGLTHFQEHNTTFLEIK